MGFFKLILGAAEVAAGIAMIAVVGPAAIPAASMLIASGAGMVLSGIGTILAGDHAVGFTATERNPIGAQDVVYGLVRAGGTLVYINEWGHNNQVLDMVVVLAGHQCALGFASDGVGSSGTPTLPAVYFDRRRVTIEQSYVPNAARYGLPRPVGPGSGSSFSPSSNYLNPKYNWNITSITRSNDVVTVNLATGIPFLSAGDQAAIRNVDQNFPGVSVNGVYDVAQVVAVDGSGFTKSFSILSGGNPFNAVGHGEVAPLWADFGHQVYVEFIDGTQTVGETFVGFEAGTPWKGTGQLVNPASPGPAGTAHNDSAESNISGWTNSCSLAGKTAVFLRLIFDGTSSSPSTYFPNGLPQISFQFRGKNDIYDPRFGSYGYTTNPALCIADFLNGYGVKDQALRTNPPPLGPYTTLPNPPLFGFGALYGTEIPLNDLITAANLCDLWVPTLGIAGNGAGNTGFLNGPAGTEPLYSLNGKFKTSMRRGEVLQNMLTSCAGRLSVVGGQFFIQPGAWTGSAAPAVDLLAIAAGPFEWRPTTSIRERYNAIKGTYVSPANGWQSSDFPYYAQDSEHGYDPSNLIPQFQGDVNLQADGGQRRWKDIQLPFTTSPSMAQRIAKIELLRTLHAGTGTFRCNMAAYQYVPFDVLLATNSILGWHNKPVEVANCRLKFTKQQLAQDTEVMLLTMELDVQETDASIYAWSTDEQLTPQGYQQAQIPHGQIPQQVPWPASPGYVAPLNGDAVYPQGPYGPGNFGLTPQYITDAQGNQTLTVQIKGFPPFNLTNEDIVKPLITAVGTTGGFVPAGIYVVALAARDSSDPVNFKLTDFLNSCNVTVGSFGAVAVTVTQWGSGDVGGDLYMARWNQDEEFAWHYQMTLAVGQTSALISSFNESTPGGPDVDFDHYGIVWQKVVHAGDWADTVAAVTPTTISIGANGMTNNQWAGYTLSLLAKAQSGVDVPILNMPVVASSASSGGVFTLTIGTNSAGVQLPDLTTLLGLEDLVVMRPRATFTANSFSDPNIANGFYPNGATGVEQGHLAIVLSGADVGDVQTIASVSQDSNGKYTIFNLQGTWNITPQTGDIVVICEATQADFYATAPIAVKNAANGAITIAQPVIDNLANQTWLLIVSTLDKNNNDGPTQYMPMRDIYFFGAGGTRTVTANYTMVATDGIILADATAGPITITLLPLAQIANQSLRIQKADSTPHAVTVQLQAGDMVTDATGTWSTQTLTNQGDFVFLPGV